MVTFLMKLITGLIAVVLLLSAGMVAATWEPDRSVEELRERWFVEKRGSMKRREPAEHNQHAPRVARAVIRPRSGAGRAYPPLAPSPRPAPSSTGRSPVALRPTPFQNRQFKLFEQKCELFKEFWP